MMQRTPKSLRLHIGLFGRRNTGKSSVLNAITRQDVSLVSSQAGTTTDPVEKVMEMLPLGPVVFVDTAGVDDEGALGEARVERTRKVLERVDLAVIITESGVWGEFEQGLLNSLRQRGVPVVVGVNKADISPPADNWLDTLRASGIQPVVISALTGTGIRALRDALADAAPPELIEIPSLLGDLVPVGGMAILVTPIDMEAPKGRLIMPQVQSIRDLLDHDAMAMVVKERELRLALERLNAPPDLVVTDSQAFLKVAADTPDSVPMTSFSILQARRNGDLDAFAAGAAAIDRLRDGDRVLMAESCTHHPIGDDIGRVKIPRWLRQYTGCQLDFQHVQGLDFPDDLSGFALVVQCGGCSVTRRVILSRVARCRMAGVPITNYGIAIAHALGITRRALAPFPSALQALLNA